MRNITVLSASALVARFFSIALRLPRPPSPTGSRGRNSSQAPYQSEFTTNERSATHGGKFIVSRLCAGRSRPARRTRFRRNP